MVGRNSKLWEHFNRITEYKVSCKHCDTELTSKHSSSNLLRHLYRRHKTIARQFDLEDVRDVKPITRAPIVDLNKLAKRQMVEDDSIDSIDNDFSKSNKRLEPIFELQMDQELHNINNQSQYSMASGSPESQQLLKKLEAETRYFDEMALLAQARRKYIEMQTLELEAKINEARKSNAV